MVLGFINTEEKEWKLGTNSNRHRDNRRTSPTDYQTWNV